MTKRDAAKLYAILISEEIMRRDCPSIAASKYLAFLRKQAKHGDAYCPYARAIKLIGAQ